MKIVNLTQHAATPEQREAGVVDLTGDDHAQLADLLTFRDIPARQEVIRRARAIAELADGYEGAMIGGAPYLMAVLEAALQTVGVQPLYAFSRRESAEVTNEDGSVRKVNIFRHLGFVKV